MSPHSRLRQTQSSTRRVPSQPGIVEDQGHKQDRVKEENPRSRRIIGRRIHQIRLSDIAGEAVDEGAGLADALRLFHGGQPWRQRSNDRPQTGPPPQLRKSISRSNAKSLAQKIPNLLVHTLPRKKCRPVRGRQRRWQFPEHYG